MFYKKSYSEIVASVLEHITKGLTREKHLFQAPSFRYELEARPENKPIKQLVQVEGFFKGEKHTFRQNIDYVLKDDRIEWSSANADIPDDKSIFEVVYLFENQTSLTDINVGSVLRNLLEAVSREIEFLYEEMATVYQSGFIDTAAGSSLDLVVSILGIKRKDPTHANGYVTFLRESEPGEANNSEAILFDGRDVYPLKTKPVITVTGLTGYSKGKSRSFAIEKDFVLEADSIKWLPEGKKPDEKKEFTVEYTSYQIIPIPAGTIVSTLPQRGEKEVLFQTRNDATLERNPDDKWESTIEVVSMEPGPHGNVIAGNIRVMPQPIEGIDKVINRSNMAGGAGPEDDVSLRARAKKILDVKGKATLESLTTALEGIEGIQTTPVLIDMPDGVQGVVRAIVDGGDEKEIERVIEQTRAAGIKVEYARPKMVMLDISVILVVSKRTLDTSKVVSEAETIIKNFVSSMGIGESLIVNQIVSLLLRIAGVLDVHSLQINAARETVTGGYTSVSAGPPLGGQTGTSGSGATATATLLTGRENVLVNKDERPYPRTVEVRTEVAVSG